MAYQHLKEQNEGLQSTAPWAAIGKLCPIIFPHENHITGTLQHIGGFSHQKIDQSFSVPTPNQDDDCFDLYSKAVLGLSAQRALCKSSIQSGGFRIGV